MTDITDKMVEAACEAYANGNPDEWPSSSGMRDALSAALSTRPAQEPVAAVEAAEITALKAEVSTLAQLRINALNAVGILHDSLMEERLKNAALSSQRGEDSTTSPASDVMAALIKRIAEVSAAVGWQAGEPALEAAGQIVSVLAANPEHIERFMADGPELFIDGTFNPENGSLTYRALNGSILSPSVLREKKGQQQ